MAPPIGAAVNVALQYKLLNCHVIVIFWLVLSAMMQSLQYTNRVNDMMVANRGNSSDFAAGSTPGTITRDRSEEENTLVDDKAGWVMANKLQELAVKAEPSFVDVLKSYKSLPIKVIEEDVRGALVAYDSSSRMSLKDLSMAMGDVNRKYFAQSSLTQAAKLEWTNAINKMLYDVYNCYDSPTLKCGPDCGRVGGC